MQDKEENVTRRGVDLPEGGQERIWDALSGGKAAEDKKPMGGVNAKRLQLANLPLVQDTPAVALTAERGTTHGDFDDNATLSQTLKDAIRGFQRKDGTYPWHSYTPAMKDSLDMFCAKIGRIAAGQAAFKDHWADIAGYAQLIADRCPD